MKKVCSVCKIEKPLSDYYNSKKSKDGKCYRCISCDKFARQKYLILNKERDRELRKWERIRRKYGLTKQQYEDLWSSQDGKCPICQNTLKEGWTKRHDKNRACIDHCHNTGKVRGILCSMCNKGIGLIGDTYESAVRAVKYLEDHK